MSNYRMACLGCRVNQYDAAAAQTALEQLGYTRTQGAADIGLVFTCTVTAEARRKSLQALRGMAKKCGAVIACGCLAQQEGAALLDVPGVELVVGNQGRDWSALLAMDRPHSAVELFAAECPFEETPVSGTFAGRTRAYVKVQEGCNRHCAYCAVPSVRGPERSRGVDGIRRECRALARAGVQEVTLTGIQLSSYGSQWSGSLAQALRAAADSGIPRLRIGSLEADGIDEAMVAALADIPALCHHFHLPLQTADEGVQATMGRTCGARQVARAIELLRGAFPQAEFTADVLLGFPGESDEAARRTLDFCREHALMGLHAFGFSPRPGTVAYDMPGRVPQSDIDERVRQAIALEAELSAKARQRWMGKAAQVLFEEAKDGIAQGHTRENLLVERAGVAPGTLMDIIIE